MKTLYLATALSMLAMPGSAIAQRSHDPYPPRYDDLMTAMCKSQAQEKSCVVGNKRLTYWISFDTIVDGRKWYTAIATAEPAAGFPDFVPPDTKLGLSQVTYELKNGSWQLLTRQLDFGAIYAASRTGNPPMEDDTGEYFSKPLSDGVLVGYPNRMLAGEGQTLHAHAIFRSAPDKSGRWLFGGNIVGATDNDVGCDRESAPGSCFVTRASLTLTGQKTGQWPDIKVDLTGTLPVAGGKVRAAKASDASVWRYDAAKGAYTTPEAP
ncbi:hypothetical protein TPR58_06515 [Sphingomonas sp. HF-S3]|uniref:Uncharacterized protein n=1 Tax=Sphingomonas rustica TaxID=3103142 RepID=A0ABV0B7W4_9SPHN